MNTSFRAFLFATSALVLAACGRAGGASVDPPVVIEAGVTAPSVQASARPPAPGTTTPVATAAPIVHKSAALKFNAVIDELGKRCDPKKRDDTTVGMKEQGLASNRCRVSAMNTALDQVLLPLKSNDNARFKALMAEQADFNRYYEAACSVSETSMWLDFETGMKDDGTMRSLNEMACIDAAASDRYFYARALKEKDAASLAKRITGAQARGEKAKKDLERMSKQTEVLLTKAIPADTGAVPRPLQRAERGELSTKVKTALEGPPAIARAMCDGWPALAEALGGEALCQSKVALYTYAHAGYGREQTQ